MSLIIWIRYCTWAAGVTTVVGTWYDSEVLCCNIVVHGKFVGIHASGKVCVEVCRNDLIFLQTFEGDGDCVRTKHWEVEFIRHFAVSTGFVDNVLMIRS